jgi:hypothetical protein
MVFKLGLTELESDVLGKKIINCIAAYNKGLDLLQMTEIGQQDGCRYLIHML